MSKGRHLLKAFKDFLHHSIFISRQFQLIQLKINFQCQRSELASKRTREKSRERKKTKATSLIGFCCRFQPESIDLITKGHKKQPMSFFNFDDLRFGLILRHKIQIQTSKVNRYIVAVKKPRVMLGKKSKLYLARFTEITLLPRQYSNRED